MILILIIEISIVWSRVDGSHDIRSQQAILKCSITYLLQEIVNVTDLFTHQDNLKDVNTKEKKHKYGRYSPQMGNFNMI